MRLRIPCTPSQASSLSRPTSRKKTCETSMALLLHPLQTRSLFASQWTYCELAWLLLLHCPPPIEMGGEQSICPNSLRMIPAVKPLRPLQRASSEVTCKIRFPTYWPLLPLLSSSRRMR